MSESAQTQGGSLSSLGASASPSIGQANPDSTSTAQFMSAPTGRPTQWGGGPPPWVTAGGWRPPPATTIVVTSSPSSVSNLAISSSSTVSSDSSSILTSSSSSVATTIGQTTLSSSSISTPPQIIVSPTTPVSQPISPSTSISAETKGETEPKASINKPAIALGITASIIFVILLLIVAFWYGRRWSSKTSQDGLEKQETGTVDSEGIRSIEIGNSVMLGSKGEVEMEGRRSPAELDGETVAVEVYGGDVREERNVVGIGVWLKDVAPTEGDLSRGGARRGEVEDLSDFSSLEKEY